MGEQTEGSACIERSEKSQPEEAGRLLRLRVLRQVNCEGQERRENGPPLTVTLPSQTAEKDVMTEDKRMSLIEHLTELRRCLSISLIAIGVSFVAAFYFSEQILKFFTGLIPPDKGSTFVFLSPAEALWSNFKVALFAGIILSLPIVLYQIWRFVSPALSEAERRYGVLFLILVILSFGIGLAFCYFVVLRLAMNFLLSYKTAGLTPMISIGYYLDFVIKFMLAFGIIFELPFIIIFLTRIGLFTPEFLAKNRKYAILVNFIIAAVLTPTPDVFNQLLMAVPLIILYEVGIIGARIVRKKAEV